MILDIFILFSIIFIIHELLVFIDPYTYDKQLLNIRKNLSVGYLNPNDRPFIIFNLFYFIWSIIGMLTPLWPYFVTLILLGYISGIKIKAIEETIKRLRMRRIDSLIALTILFFLLVSNFLR